MSVKDIPQIAPSRMDEGSLRDPDNRVFDHAGNIYRALGEHSAGGYRMLQSKSFYRRAVNTGRIVATDIVPKEAYPPLPAFDFRTALILRHERIPFISYPFEWTFGMLREAALLHLSLLEGALGEGMTLKDASSYNIQWQGCRPVFIDICSFEESRPGPWIAYRQFCQLFLYPLLMWSHLGIDPRPWLRASVDGITPAQCRAHFRSLDIFRAGVFKHVYLHAHFDQHFSATKQSMVAELRKDEFSQEMVLKNVRGLQKLIDSLSSPKADSHWSHYSEERNYSDEAWAGKIQFVKRCLAIRRPSLVWDLGCNSGEFSRLAADYSDYVVAMDGDAHVIENFYQESSSLQPSRLLPLVMDLTNPSPGLGWRCRERKALTERRRPDLILCLALVHHLAITAHIPLGEIVAWLADLGNDLVIEFVSRKDEKTRQLLKNMDVSYDEYTQEAFEAALRAHYRIRNRWSTDSETRTLYECSALKAA